MPTRTYRLAAAIVRPLLRVLFRPSVSGTAHLPPGGYVLCANQLSNFDGPALAYGVRTRQVQWMGKAELFRGPAAPVLRRLGVFPVRRGEADIGAVRTAAALARSGAVVGVFPEGTRRAKGVRKRREARPQTGAARAALGAGVPLVPAAIVGTDHLTSLERWRVAFGPPLDLADVDADAPGAPHVATNRLMHSIGELEAGLRADAARSARRLHPRLRLDIGGSDLAAAAIACLTARQEGRDEGVLAAWGQPRGLVCLSVRSAFELLLDVLQLEPGAEVAFSAVTHPDMVRIAEARGLIAVPVDLDPETLAPTPAALERALTPRTRVLVIAHLFGGRADLRALAHIARERDVLVVEDCAQCLRGAHDAGDPAADVSLFSFGAIKTATALGGGLVRVSDTALADRMSEIQSRWPRQHRRVYARRVATFAGLRALSQPRIYWLFARTLESTGRDLDAIVNGAVRGFPGADLARRLRQRPSAPLLALLERRLRRFDTARLDARAAAGERLVSALPALVDHPGRAADLRTHWVVPVLTDDGAGLVAQLRSAGFDATPATTSIAAISAPVGREELRPDQARDVMERVVFIPAYPELGEAELARVAAVVRDFARDDH